MPMSTYDIIRTVNSPPDAPRNDSTLRLDALPIAQLRTPYSTVRASSMWKGLDFTLDNLKGHVAEARFNNGVEGPIQCIPYYPPTASYNFGIVDHYRYRAMSTLMLFDNQPSPYAWLPYDRWFVTCNVPQPVSNYPYDAHLGMMPYVLGKPGVYCKVDTQALSYMSEFCAFTPSGITCDFLGNRDISCSPPLEATLPPWAILDSNQWFNMGSGYADGGGFNNPLGPDYGSADVANSLKTTILTRGQQKLYNPMRGGMSLIIPIQSEARLFLNIRVSKPVTTTPAFRGFIRFYDENYDIISTIFLENTVALTQLTPVPVDNSYEYYYRAHEYDLTAVTIPGRAVYYDVGGQTFGFIIRYNPITLEKYFGFGSFSSTMNSIEDGDFFPKVLVSNPLLP